MGIQVQVPEEFKLIIAMAQGEISAILEKYQLQYAVVELRVNGMPQSMEAQLVPRPGARPLPVASGLVMP